MKLLSGLLLIFGLILFSCKRTGETVLPALENTNFFSLNFPDGWRHQPMQGVDSAIGYFYSKSDTIFYDHGSMARQDIKRRVEYNNGKILEEFKKNNSYFTLYEYKERETGQYLVGCYVYGHGISYQITSLIAKNTGRKSSLMKIMKTHQFVHQE